MTGIPLFHWRIELRTIAALLDRNAFDLARVVARRAADTWPPNSDDAEPITYDWFKQTFGGYFIEFPADEWREMWIYMGSPDLIELGLRDKRWQGRSGGEVHYQLRHVMTRRQIYDLIEALGWRKEE